MSKCLSTEIKFFGDHIAFWPTLNCYYNIPDPTNQNDVQTRSNAQYAILANLRSTALRMLPLSQPQGTILNAGNVILALKHTYIRHLNNELAPGNWITNNGFYGSDLISLYATINDVNYDKAAKTLETALSKGQKFGTFPYKGLHQELHPLCHQDNNQMYYSANPSDYCVFKNASGKIIATATKLSNRNEKAPIIYRTLWKPSKSNRSQWATILPKEPIFYNRDMMELYQNAPVWISLSPFDAMKKEQNYSEWLHTALPNGPVDLSTADLDFLQDRQVHIELDQTGLENALAIHKAFKANNDNRLSYSFDGVKVSSFEEICTEAESKNILIKGLKAEKLSANDNQLLISKSGSRVHGAEIQRKMLVDPFIKEGYLVWVYAPEKTGKSWLASAIAHAVATGKTSVGNWTVKDKAGVLLIDGEMLPDELESSISQITSGAGAEFNGLSFDVICAKSQNAGVIDILDETWQHKIENHLKGKKLLILDNLQSLTSNGGSRIDELQNWLRSLNQKSIAILILDHSNSEGELQGSINKRRIANVVISMSPAVKDNPRNGETIIDYILARSLSPNEVKPFILKRIHRENSVSFTVKEITGSKKEPKIDPRILKMAKVCFAKNELEMTFDQIHKELGIARSTAHDLIKSSSSLSEHELVDFEEELNNLRKSGIEN